MRARKKIIKRAAACLLILTAAAAIALSALAYPYIRERIDLPYTTFRPFSGRLFDFKLDQVHYICTSGDSDSPHMHYFRSDEEITEVIELLNSFRYYCWKPEPMGEKALPFGGSRSVSLDLMYPQTDGSTVHIHYVAYENRLLFNNVWYYGDPAFFKKLRELRDCGKYHREHS